MASLMGIAGEPGSEVHFSQRSACRSDSCFDCDGKGLNWKGWKKDYCKEKK